MNHLELLSLEEYLSGIEDVEILIGYVPFYKDLIKVNPEKMTKETVIRSGINNLAKIIVHFRGKAEWSYYSLVPFKVPEEIEIKINITKEEQKLMQELGVCTPIVRQLMTLFNLQF